MYGLIGEGRKTEDGRRKKGGRVDGGMMFFDGLLGDGVGCLCGQKTADRRPK